MTVDSLRALVKVVELGTVTHAAEALCIAQPALSRQIHALERELGQPLFLRQGRRLALTPFGQQVVQHAQAVIQEVDALQHLRDRKTATTFLRLGASLTTLNGFLPRVVARLRTVAPGVDITVRTGLSQDVYDLVANGLVELGVVSAPRPRPFIIAQSLFLDPLCVLCPPGHPLTEQHAIRPEDLDGMALVTMTARTVLRQDLNALFATLNIRPRISMEIDDIGALEGMVAAGLGVTVLPLSTAGAHQPTGSIELRPFHPSPEHAAIQLARRVSIIRLDTPLSAAAQLWMQLCLDVGIELEKDIAHLGPVVHPLAP